MKSSKEMTEDILVRRDEYVALKRKKIKMFTGSSATILGFAVIVSGSTLLLNSGVMDSHVPVDTNLSITVSEDAPASQAPVKKNTERIVNNSSEVSVSVALTSSEYHDNTQPEINPNENYVAPVFSQDAEIWQENDNRSDFVAVPAVSTVPVSEHIKNSEKSSGSSSRASSVSSSSKESVSHKEEVSESKKVQVTTSPEVSNDAKVSSVITVTSVNVTTPEAVSDTQVQTEPSSVVSESSVSSSVSESVTSVSTSSEITSEASDYYVYYELASDELTDNSVFENMKTVSFNDSVYEIISMPLENEFARFIEYLPSKESIDGFDIYYVRKMRMIALVKDGNLALYSPCYEQSNEE